MSSLDQDNDDDDIPFYLMPVAAVLGMYVLMGGGRLGYLIYVNLTNNKNNKEYSFTSRPFVTLTTTVFFAAICYAHAVARVEGAYKARARASFDPYEIMGITEANIVEDPSIIQQTYRTLSKVYHPDNKSDGDLFRELNLAYRALTTDRENYETYGHPDGKYVRPTFQFAFPRWLLFPPGNVAIIMMLLYFAMLSGAAYFAVLVMKQQQDKTTTTTEDESSNDLEYMATMIMPNSNEMDILYIMASAPEVLKWSQKQLEKVDEIKRDRLKQQEQEKPKTTLQKAEHEMSFDVDDEGWDNDEDADSIDEDEKKAKQQEAKEAALRARQAEQEKQKRLEDVKKASGQVKILMEGMDEGVIGQKWVETSLATKNEWPPKDLGILKDKQFPYNNDQQLLGAMDHPALRRVLCMIQGRLNSLFLNTHPDLLEAGSKQMVDQSYFKGSLEFRQRAGYLLDAMLRLAITLRSYPLARTIVETIAMFRIGCYNNTEGRDWFRQMLQKQYGTLPRLEIVDKKLVGATNKNLVVDNRLLLEIQWKRPHAEQFKKQKIAVAQKQGIPPQVALSTFREGWWFFVRCELQDGPRDKLHLPIYPDNPLFQKFKHDDVINRFENAVKSSDKLLNALPIVVQNVGLETATAKVFFKAPNVPGKYRFVVNVKSQDFLGCSDVEFTMEDQYIMDKKEGQQEKDTNKEKEEKEDTNKEAEKEQEKEDAAQDEEPKKEK